MLQSYFLFVKNAMGAFQLSLSVEDTGQEGSVIKKTIRKNWFFIQYLNLLIANNFL